MSRPTALREPSVGLELLDAAPVSQALAPARGRRPARVFRWRFGPDLVCLVGFAAVFAVHYIVLSSNGEPSGIDFGNWLTFGHATLGSHIPGGSASVYPPLVPVLAVGATNLFGVAHADWLLASTLACVPGLGAYVVLRSAKGRYWAALIATLICAGKATGEAATWGGLPQLLGLGLSVLTLWSLARLCRDPRPGRAWQTGLLLLATAAASHLIVSQTAVAGLLMLAIWAALVRKRPRLLGRRGVLLLGLRVILPSIPLIPLYLTLFDTVGQSYVSTAASSNLVNATYGVFRETPLLWISAMVLSLATPILLWRRRREQLWHIAVGMWMAELLFLVAAPNDRLAYFLPLCTVLSLGLWMPRADGPVLPLPRSHEQTPAGDPARRRTHRQLAVLTSLVVVAVMAFSGLQGLRAFPGQRAFYGDSLVPRGTTAALNWLRNNTPKDAVVATAPVRGVPFGWWVEGYGRRAAVVAADPDFLNFQRERDRAALAVSLFNAPDLSDPKLLSAARAAHIDYLFIPARWDGINPAGLEQIRKNHPAEYVFHNTAATILKVSP